MPVSDTSVMGLPDPLLIRASLEAWPAKTTISRHGFLLRSDPLPHWRCNSAFLQHHSGNLAIQFRDATRYFRDQQKIPRFMVISGLHDELSQVLKSEKGFVAIKKTDYMLAPLHVLADLGKNTPGRPAITISLEHRPTNLAISAIAGSKDKDGRSQLSDLLNRIRTPIAIAAACLEDGAPVAGGICVVNGSYAGIFSLATATHYRGMGLARSVIKRLSEWATNMGSEMAYVQVESDNHKAVELYKLIGFNPVCSYTYWTAPG